MNASSRFRRVTRLWRVGAVVLGLVIVGVVALVAVGRQHASYADSVAQSPLPRANTTQTTTYAPAATAAPASTASAGAARPASGVAVAPNAAPASTTGRSSSTTSSSTNDASGLNVALPPQQIDQKVIRNGTISITVKDVAGIQNTIWSLAAELGGTVLTSNTSGTDDSVRADITFRVPADRYKDAMDRVRGFGVKVLNEQSTSQDVTEEYVDLQARQRNLEATAAQLTTLLGKATTVDETLKVQTQLNATQGDIERIKGKLNYYDRRSDFSTITVTLLPVLPVKAAPVTPVAKWSLVHSIQEAWNRSVNSLQNVADALITVIVGGWWIEIPLLIAIYLLVRRERRRQPILAPVAVAVSPIDAGEGHS